MDVLDSIDYGNSRTWIPNNSKEELIITPHKAISYAIGNEDEEIGNITITFINDDLFIDVINVWVSYMNKGYEILLVKYVQELHDKTLYIKPSNPTQIQWLAELNFEPLYVEDWSPNSVQAPWESGYKEMIYIPNPSNPMQLASFHKRFLMALSDYVLDINRHEPELYEVDNDNYYLKWVYQNKEFKSYCDKDLGVITYCINTKDNTSMYIDVSTYQGIQRLVKWFIKGLSVEEDNLLKESGE